MVRFYGTVAGAIAFLHGNTVNRYQPDGMFNYHWVDDHVNVSADIGTNCADAELSLRYSMTTILGPDAVNEDKFTPLHVRQKVLGLIFDSAAGTVSMTPDKVVKARMCVESAYHAVSLSRSDYRSLLGRFAPRCYVCPPSTPIPTTPPPTGTPLTPLATDSIVRGHEAGLTVVDAYTQITVAQWGTLGVLPQEPLACSDGRNGRLRHRHLCARALVPADRCVLCYKFANEERMLIEATKSDPSIGFDINYRELLSCAFAVQAWGPSWASRHNPGAPSPLHVQFKIDNTSAVAWHNKMASSNARAQTIIRLLGHWELKHGLRFSARHVAGVENRIADAGSRSNSNAAMSSLFGELSRGWTQVNPSSDIANLEAIWHSISEPLCRTVNLHKYRSAPRTWHTWTTRRGIQPTLINYSLLEQLQVITGFVIHGFQHGFGSGRSIRGSTIAATLHGILHFFHAAPISFPSTHPQIRMLLKGIARLDTPPSRKAPVPLRLLECCFGLLDMTIPSDQALWGVLCLSFFFLLRRSEIASSGRKFAWFALKAEDIAVLTSSGIPTNSARDAAAVHIRLNGSKTNQQGSLTLRMLNRSGHKFLCPVFGALCLLKAHGCLPRETPAAVFITKALRPGCVSAATITRTIREAATKLGYRSFVQCSLVTCRRSHAHVPRRG